MNPHIAKGRIAIREFRNSGSTDYDSLVTILKNANNQLIKSCTMQGEAHDELHKWLHPHLQLVDELSKKKDRDSSSYLVEQLEYSYQTYDTYFQLKD